MAPSHETTRQRLLVAAIVVAGHLLLALLWTVAIRAPMNPEPVAEATPIYARIIERPRPEPLGTPAPVQLTLVPVTRPKPRTPELQLIEIETLDSPAPGPDPAPSSAQLVTRPGPANAGGKGYPASMGNQGLKLVRRVAPVYPSSSMQRGEAGVVQMNAHIDAQGHVTEVRLLHSSGHELLDNAAMRAVGKWRFEPVVQDGRPASVWAPVNVEMSLYQRKYCRIRDTAADNPDGEEVLDGAGVAVPLGSEAVLRKLLDDLGSGSSEATVQIRELLSDWGPVISIRSTGDAGIQGWVNREILPAFHEGVSGATVQVRSDTYLVRHEHRLARWRVETDRTGEIWCVHVGPGPRTN